MFRMLLLVSMLTSGADEESAPGGFNVGGQNILIPTPKDLVEFAPADPLTKRVVDAGIPDENRLLAMFLPADKAGKTLADDPTLLVRRLCLQLTTGPELEKKGVTRAEFAEVCESIETEMQNFANDHGDVVESVNRKLAGDDPLPFALDDMKAVPLKPHFRSEDVIMMSMIIIADVADNSDVATPAAGKDNRPRRKTVSVAIPATTTMMLVNGKLITLYAFGAPDELDWTRSASQQWMEAIQKVNRTSTDSAALKSAEESELERFQAWAEDFVAEPHSNIVLPDPQQWFRGHFTRVTAGKLASEYTASIKGVESIDQLFAVLKSQGKTELRVRCVSKAIDTSATGLQNAALQRMTRKVTLYTMELVKPGEKHGYSFSSFVEEGEGFVYLGKMTALNPVKGDLITDALCNLPLKTAEETLSKSGLLKSSAEQYLREKRVLK